MKIGVLGTGVVGQTIATRLIELGHEVMIGSRSATNEKAQGWASGHGSKGKAGTFEQAAAFGELVVLATKGDVTLEIIRLSKPDNFKGKPVIDISNPLDFSKGFPPSLSVCNTDSLGEQVQRALPGAYVVKALNTITAGLMGHPEKLPEETDLFICGDNNKGKDAVKSLLQSFGWKRINDLGGISSSRATEQFLPLWLQLYTAFGNADFNVKIVKG